MRHVLVATDADSLADGVFAALAEPGTTVSRVRAGVDVRPTVAELAPDLVVLDLQIGNMGGVAASLDLRLEAEAGRVPETRILMLLDRDADRWIARQAKADAELVKPVSSIALRNAAESLLTTPVETLDETLVNESTDDEAPEDEIPDDEALVTEPLDA